VVLQPLKSLEGEEPSFLNTETAPSGIEVKSVIVKIGRIGRRSGAKLVSGFPFRKYGR
jgi:hypothetical protein